MFQREALRKINLDELDVKQLLLENVKLEGQLEMLEAETRHVIRERADLQTQVTPSVS